MLQFVGDNAAQFKTQYGNVSPASIGAIQRGLLQLEEQGGDRFFGEPMLNIDDLHPDRREGPRRRQHPRGRQADERAAALRRRSCCGCSPSSTRTFPRSATATSRSSCSSSTRRTCCSARRRRRCSRSIEQVVRLIRSKGVGVFFVTQNPLDVPDKVLGQLGNRVQHALRAFTPRDQKAVKSVADTMRPNPKLDIGKAILELATGEALVSLLDAKGAPGITERAWMLAPGSRIGPITPDERRKLIGRLGRRRAVREDRRSRVGVRDAEGARRSARRAAPGAGAGRAADDDRAAGGGMMGGHLRHPVRLDRPARRHARRHGRRAREERGAHGGVVDRARDHARRAGLAARRETAMNAPYASPSPRPARSFVAACGSPQREPVPITPPADVAKAPVARVPVAPLVAGHRADAAAGIGDHAGRQARSVDVSRGRDLRVRERHRRRSARSPRSRSTRRSASCAARIRRWDRASTSATSAAAAAGASTRADGTEITMAHEAEYDKKVMRVRFKAN